MNCSDSWPNASMQHLISRRTLPMEARSNPLPAEKSLQGDRTLVLQDRLVPACRVLSFRSQAAPEGNTLQRRGSLLEYSFKSKQVALTLAMLAPTLMYGQTQSGTLDPSVGTNGIVTTDFAGTGDAVATIAVQTDGKLVAAGNSYNNVSSNFDFAVARYNSNGTLDASFGTS